MKPAAAATPTEIVRVIVGTAGHIDHGKSTLVERLTGVHPDRLAEERDRGMTIDLGFAPYALADGRRVGIIDVPGHERFVKNMVAGATSVDVVLLVVAADDGVMPQTREHLEILGLLGLERGLVVVTKTDAPGVDAELLEVLELELAELLAGTFLAGAPILRVSGVTGEGLPALRAALERVVLAVPPRATDGPFRLPIQRVFSAQGFGTVLTGVPVSGALAPGDPVEVLGPGKRLRGRVRGLHAYGAPVERVHAGHSAAVNVADVDRHAVHRGDALCTPGVFAPEALWEARLTHLASQRRPLEQRQTVRVHVGTSEVLGELVLLEGPRLAPGASALCQLRLHEPVVAAAGDRFVVRRHSPMQTFGGGVLLGASKWRLKPGKGFVLERLAAEEQALGDPKERVRVALEAARGPRRAEDLGHALQLDRAAVEAALGALAAEGAAVALGHGKGGAAWLAAAPFAAALEAVRGALAAWHRDRPLLAGCPRATIRTASGLDDATVQAALARLAAAGEVVETAQGWARADHRVVLDAPAAALRRELLARLEAGGFAAPPVAQVLAELAPPLPPAACEDLVAHLVAAGDLADLGADVLLPRARLDEARAAVARALAAGGGLSASALRDLLGGNRRVVIPLLEHLDATGLTRREGDLRVLRAAPGQEPPP